MSRDLFATYVTRAAGMLDCAVQLCGDRELSAELDGIETRLDEIAREALPAPASHAGVSRTAARYGEDVELEL